MASSIKHEHKIIAKKWANTLMELANEDANISKDSILNNLNEAIKQEYALLIKHI